MIHAPVLNVLSARRAGADLPEAVAKACAMQALCLFGITIARDAELPTSIITSVLEQTLEWVKDPSHPLGKERFEENEKPATESSEPGPSTPPI